MENMSTCDVKVGDEGLDTNEVVDVPKPREILDRGALNGLRGIAAVHIMLFHAFLSSDYSFNVMGNAVLQLFFLLSGFCLTLAYGKKPWRGATACCGPCQTVDRSGDAADNVEVFDSWTFYKNRMSRIMPVYYLCHLIAVPPIFLGYGDLPTEWMKNVFGGIEAIFAVNTWIIVHGFGPNGPAWSICTLAFFYWIFPSLIARCQRWSNEALSRWIVGLFYIQMITGMVIIGILQDMNGYWLAIAHPVTRLPVFCMGVMSGLRVLRKSYNSETATCASCCHHNILMAFIHDIFPCLLCCKRNAQNEQLEQFTERFWKWRVDLAFFSFYLTIIGLSIAGMVIKLACAQDTIKAVAFVTEGHMGFHMQLLSCHQLLMIIEGACYDGGSSIFSKFCRTKPLQFLGRISMSLYLVHWPVITYLWLAINGPISFPMDDSEAEIQRFVLAKRTRLWTVPISVIASLVGGYLVTVLIEEPSKHWLRKFTKPRT